jgi:hypothetical protein
MGKGIDLARAEAPEHAAVLDDFKAQDKYFKDAFIKLGYWPNEVLWKVWTQAIDTIASAAGPESTPQVEAATSNVLTDAQDNFFNALADAILPPATAETPRTELIKELHKYAYDLRIGEIGTQLGADLMVSAANALSACQAELREANDENLDLRNALSANGSQREGR